MAGSIRVCLIAEGFTEDLIKCVTSIEANSQIPISIYANGKSNWLSAELFNLNQVTLTQEKNPLGWGNIINFFINNCTEDFLLIMDPSTIFLKDPIPKTLEALNSGFQGAGWKGGLINLEDDGGKLIQIDLPLEQGRHHGYYDTNSDYREKNSKKNYQRILERFRGKNEILSPRR